jgi:hypothetical protein
MFLLNEAAIWDEFDYVYNYVLFLEIDRFYYLIKEFKFSSIIFLEGLLFISIIVLLGDRLYWFNLFMNLYLLIFSTLNGKDFLAEWILSILFCK